MTILVFGLTLGAIGFVIQLLQRNQKNRGTNKMNKLAGFSISVEGVDGCGKDTALKMLKVALEATGREVEVLADLYDTEVGVKVRDIFVTGTVAPDDLSTMLLVTAARRELMNTRILPAIYAGKIVLLNRFKDSTIAYQCFAGTPESLLDEGLGASAAKGMHMAKLFDSINIAAGVAYEPNYTLLLTIAPAVQQSRLAARGKLDRYDAAGPKWHAAVQAGFNYVVKQDAQYTHRRITVVDNSLLSLSELEAYVNDYASNILTEVTK